MGRRFGGLRFGLDWGRGDGHSIRLLGRLCGELLGAAEIVGYIAADNFGQVVVVEAVVKGLTVQVLPEFAV